jgi:hypothetical protein
MILKLSEARDVNQASWGSPGLGIAGTGSFQHEQRLSFSLGTAVSASKNSRS